MSALRDARPIGKVTAGVARVAISTGVRTNGTAVVQLHATGPDGEAASIWMGPGTANVLGGQIARAVADLDERNGREPRATCAADGTLGALRTATRELSFHRSERDPQETLILVVSAKTRGDVATIGLTTAEIAELGRVATRIAEEEAARLAASPASEPFIAGLARSLEGAPPAADDDLLVPRRLEPRPPVVLAPEPVRVTHRAAEPTRRPGEPPASWTAADGTHRAGGAR